MQNKVASNHVEGVVRKGLILAELSQTRAVPLSEDLLCQELVRSEVADLPLPSRAMNPAQKPAPGGPAIISGQRSGRGPANCGSVWPRTRRGAGDSTRLRLRYGRKSR